MVVGLALVIVGDCFLMANKIERWQAEKLVGLVDDILVRGCHAVVKVEETRNVRKNNTMIGGCILLAEDRCCLSHFRFPLLQR